MFRFLIAFCVFFLLDLVKSVKDRDFLLPSLLHAADKAPPQIKQGEGPSPLTRLRFVVFVVSQHSCSSSSARLRSRNRVGMFSSATPGELNNFRFVIPVQGRTPPQQAKNQTRRAPAKLINEAERIHTPREDGSDDEQRPWNPPLLERVYRRFCCATTPSWLVPHGKRKRTQGGCGWCLVCRSAPVRSSLDLAPWHETQHCRKRGPAEASRGSFARKPPRL